MPPRRRTQSDLPADIQPIGDTEKVNLMLYGPPGAGKTTFIGTGPSKTLIIRPPTDHMASIRGFGGKMWVIRNWDKMFEALEYLRETRCKDWDWVWLDSISLFQDVGLDDIWEQTVLRRPARKEFGLDKGEYGVNMFRLAQWVRHIVGMEVVNFGITAHPAEMTNPVDDERPDVLMPYVQGKNMATKICGYMNLVAYLEVTESGRRVMHTNLTERYYAKNQFKDTIPKGRLINPTIPKLMTELGL